MHHYSIPVTILRWNAVVRSWAPGPDQAAPADSRMAGRRPRKSSSIMQRIRAARLPFLTNGQAGRGTARVRCRALTRQGAQHELSHEISIRQPSGTSCKDDGDITITAPGEPVTVPVP